MRLPRWCVDDGLLGKKMNIFEQIDNLLTEAKSLMYHGTSTKFLRSILKQGIIPNPKKQRWGKDMDSDRKAVQPVATLDGYIYLAKSGYMARDIATDAAKKFGGEALVVIAQVELNSVAVDHDDLTGPVNDAVYAISREYAPDDAGDPSAWMLGYMHGVETARRIEIGEKFGKILADYIGASNTNVLSHEIEKTEGVRSSLPTKILMMYLALSHRRFKNSNDLTNGYISSQQDYWVDNGVDINIPLKGEEWTAEDREQAKYEIEKTEREWPRKLSTSELEDEWRETIRGVSERLGGAVGAEGSRAKGAMINDPLNYRGSNRIMAVVEIEQSEGGVPLSVTVHYNAMSDSALEKLLKSKVVSNSDIEFAA